MNSMSQQVFKYNLEWDDGPGLRLMSLPSGARFLNAANQHGHLVMWCLVNTDNPPEDRRFYLLETGKEYPTHHKYLTTVLLENGNYVLHILEKQR